MGRVGTYRLHNKPNKRFVQDRTIHNILLQIQKNVKAKYGIDFTPEELAEIPYYQSHCTVKAIRSGLEIRWHRFCSFKFMLDGIDSRYIKWIEDAGGIENLIKVYKVAGEDVEDEIFLPEHILSKKELKELNIENKKLVEVASGLRIKKELIKRKRVRLK